MSIIFGYINLTNKPVERETLDRMKSAMDFWGPDGQGTWIDATCGLGNLLLYNTPEALFEKLPVTDVSGNLVMTAGARIDNREELFRTFDIPLGQQLCMPDSALMLKAYEKWGEACADHLVGDWAFAIWDQRQRKLFLARDHHGITAMYYYKGEDFFVFSSSLKGILCLPQVPKKINEYKIAQLLVNWNEGGPTTCYMDIMRLPPAHTLSLSDGKVTTNRYWYLEHTPEVRLKNDQEYVDMFLHLYTEAVRCRLRSHRPVGATLSGGLDSGSVCILAARELAKEGKRLQAYTAVPLYDTTGLVPPNRIGDEGPLALALAEKLGNVDVTLCRAEGISPFEGVERSLSIHSHPGVAVSNAFWIIDILDKCKIDNCGTVLIGQFGNGTVSWPPNNLLNNSAFKYRIALSKDFLKIFLGRWNGNFLAKKDFLKKHGIRRNLLSEKYEEICYDYNLNKIRIQIFKKGIQSATHLWHELSNFSKLEVRDPTLDLLLVKFLFGNLSKSNNNRDIFTNIFHQYFLKEVLNGRLKGKQSVDLLKRINKLEKIFPINLLSSNDLSDFNKCFKNIKQLNYPKNLAQLLEVLKIYSLSLFIEKLR
jgi:asparagine synthase (glutamine-hydrolysing)